MPIRNLFSTPEGNSALDLAMNFLKNFDKDLVWVRLTQVLRIIRVNAEEFDRGCQLNIAWIGESTLERLNDINLESHDIKDRIDKTVADIFRFVTEYDLSIRGDLPVDFAMFRSAVIDNESRFNGKTKGQIEFAQRDMAAAIVKQIINSEDFGNLRDLSAVTARLETRIQDWNTSLEVTEKKATQLSLALETHTRAFNFVGLHEGFSELSENIKAELSAAQKQMLAFGFLVMMPSLLEICLIASKTVDLDKITMSALIATSLATVAITLILLYFFRISLRQADSSRAQLIQVRLRMSLCRFIQSYAEYSGEIKSKNGAALDKFESLIFSGIVSSDEKLPSTFDGIEQLASLAKSVRGGS